MDTDDLTRGFPSLFCFPETLPCFNCGCPFDLFLRSFTRSPLHPSSLNRVSPWSAQSQARPSPDAIVGTGKGKSVTANAFVTATATATATATSTVLLPCCLTPPPVLASPFCSDCRWSLYQGSSGGGEGFEVTKFGHGRVALIGFPRYDSWHSIQRAVNPDMAAATPGTTAGSSFRYDSFQYIQVQQLAVRRNATLRKDSSWHAHLPTSSFVLTPSIASKAAVTFHQ